MNSHIRSTPRARLRITTRRFVVDELREGRVLRSYEYRTIGRALRQFGKLSGQQSADKEPAHDKT